MALAPAILAAIVLLAGLALIGNDAFLVIRFVVSILALIVCVFAWQARQWWWFALLIPIAVVWNPVYPITGITGDLWLAFQYIAAIVFIVIGVLVRVPNSEDKNARPAKRPKSN
jgi:uncharacterized membrane protein YoaK (UPF0700 family)